MQDGCATQDVAHPVAVTVTLASQQRPTATTRHLVTASGEPPASRRRAAGAPHRQYSASCLRLIAADGKPRRWSAGREYTSTAALPALAIVTAGPGWAIAKAAMYTASAGCCHVISAARLACH